MAFQRILNNQELASFCAQTAMLFQAGITPVESMELLLTDAKTTDAKKIYQDLYDTCVKGETFYQALVSSSVFPEYVLNMVSLGETSGNLDIVMNSLTEYYEREEEISASVKETLRYPFIMIILMFFVILVLITKVLPVFQQVFLQLGSDMTGMSFYMLQFGKRINQYFIIFLAFFIFLCIFYFIGKRFQKCNQFFHTFWYHFALTKNFYSNIAAERFASGMALALSSGLDTFQSLDLTTSLVENPLYKEKIMACKKSVENGTGFVEAISESQIFSHFYNKMLAIGWRTGSADVIMRKIATDYDQKVTQKLQSIIAIIEPTLVIILSLIIGVILLSVIMPLLGIMSSIG